MNNNSPLVDPFSGHSATIEGPYLTGAAIFPSERPLETIPRGLWVNCRGKLTVRTQGMSGKAGNEISLTIGDYGVHLPLRITHFLGWEGDNSSALSNEPNVIALW